MYVSVIASILGVLFFKQTTILAETFVIVLAFLVPLAIAYAITRNEQIKLVCFVLGIFEIGLVFAIFAGSMRW